MTQIKLIEQTIKHHFGRDIDTVEGQDNGDDLLFYVYPPYPNEDHRIEISMGPSRCVDCVFKDIRRELDLLR